MDIVFATHNPNKLKELQQIVPRQIKLLSLSDINCSEDIKEDGLSIQENALIKARYVFNKYNMPCFGDDTGLLVDALDGAPGIYSARYAGPQKNAQDNINRLLDELKQQKNRKAHFKTVIAYKSAQHEECFTGICKGEILLYPRGEKGFGYDPVFKPHGFDLSFAEMSAENKNKISHRGLATNQLIAFLSSL